MLRILITSMQRWQRDEAPMLAAAVSYYLAMSLFPVLLILTSALGVFFKWTDNGQDAREYLLQVISDQMAPAVAQAIEQSLAHIEDYSPLSGPVGLAFLLFAGLAIFSQFECAFMRIWDTPAAVQQGVWSSLKRMLTHRLRAFALLCGMGALLVTVFIAGFVLDAFRQGVHLESVAWMWWALELALKISINTLAFSCLYRFLPVAYVRWKDACRGGLFAALVWEIGLLLVSKLLIGNYYTSAYGVIGCFLAVMLSGYYAVSVVFFGAELVQVLGQSAPATNPALAAENNGAPNIKPSRRNKGAAPMRVQFWRSPWVDAVVVALLVYVGLFLGLRQFNSKEADVGTQAPQRIVRFSEDPARHKIAVTLFTPLIKSFPGPYQYASAAGDTHGQM